ncbi:hypothetical protein J2Z37_004970 [Ammoniphilus resinae]|uniref:Uncharacterized protein n=1 Tax=Ammoniphilus resinae TaxID=861532 RepID=A0ABS4GXE8_9BACL|nr:hypothetical protein [Ammoniphilus resinae]
MLQNAKGTLFVFDTFEFVTEEELHEIFNYSEKRGFSQVIFYPQHEETLRRMNIPVSRPYFKRLDLLFELLEESTHVMPASIDQWEGKRKKYTPIETSLSFLTEKYQSPHFVLMNAIYADKISTYKGFEEQIRKIRLIIRAGDHFRPNGILQKYTHRWEEWKSTEDD